MSESDKVAKKAAKAAEKALKDAKKAEEKAQRDVAKAAKAQEITERNARKEAAKAERMENPDSAKQGRYWTFTRNNYTVDDEKSLKAAFEDGKLVYVIYGKEIGESKTPHLQGYCESNKTTARFIRSLIPKAHIEFAIKPKAARDYCLKDGNIVEYGVFQEKSQGKRSDIEVLHEDLKSGKPLKEIAEDNFGLYLRYYKSIENYRFLQGGKSEYKQPQVDIYWGASGTGKSRLARESPIGTIHVQANHKWFDGYSDQKTVIFDDFYGKHDTSYIPLGDLLKLTDGYKDNIVQVKGASRYWMPEKIVFTSNMNPDEWFQTETEEAKAAFKRRISRTIYFSENGDRLEHKGYNTSTDAHESELVIETKNISPSTGDERSAGNSGNANSAKRTGKARTPKAASSSPVNVKTSILSCFNV